jgi:hypothetical protein
MGRHSLPGRGIDGAIAARTSSFSIGSAQMDLGLLQARASEPERDLAGIAGRLGASVAPSLRCGDMISLNARKARTDQIFNASSRVFISVPWVDILTSEFGA